MREIREVDYDPRQPPNLGVEVLGRGERTRRSKTYLKDLELAALMGFIEGHITNLAEILRRLHERKYGDRLDDHELREKYPAVRLWERLHAAHIGHYASLEGFTIKAQSGLTESGTTERRQESTAGTDHTQRNGADTKWR